MHTDTQTDRQTDVRIVVESCRRYSVYSSRSQRGPPARAVQSDDKLWLRAGTWQYFLADPARRRRRRRTLWQNAGHWFTAASTGRRLLKPTISTRYWRVTHDEPTHRRFKQTYTIQQHDATCAVFNRALKNEPPPSVVCRPPELNGEIDEKRSGKETKKNNLCAKLDTSAGRSRETETSNFRAFPF